MNDDGPQRFVGRLVLILLTLLVAGAVRGFFHKEKSYKIEPTPEERAYVQDVIDQMFEERRKKESEEFTKAFLKDLEAKKEADLSAETVTAPPATDQAPNSSQSNP